MAESFKRSFKARWGDMDFNQHMSNTAYLDLAGDVRMMYFEEKGFSMENFLKLNVGPVVFKDEIQYFKEIKLLEDIEAHLLMAGYSKDGSRFCLRNIFYRGDGRKAAILTSYGGWLDISKRSLTSPPPGLFDIFKRLEKTEDFQELTDSSKHQ